MPIYRKGRTPSTHPEHERSIRRINGKRQLRHILPWTVESTPLEIVEKALKYKIREKIGRLKKPVVVDWGCGKGVAAEAIAKTFPNARVIGFSREFYRNWLAAKESGATFIHAEANDFKMYFKDDSIDIIYSFSGLDRLVMQRSENNWDITPRKAADAEILVAYLRKQVIPKLKKGGILVMSLLRDYRLPRARLNVLRALRRMAEIKISTSGKGIHLVIEKQ